MLTDGIKKLFVFKAIRFLFNYKRGVKKDFDVNVQSLKFIIPNNECIVRECTAESHSINKYTNVQNWTTNFFTSKCYFSYYSRTVQSYSNGHLYIFYLEMRVHLWHNLDL